MLKAQIWTIDNCPYCVRAKKLLDLKGIEYEEKQGFHPDWKSVPYILVDGEPIGGFTEFAQFCRNLK